MTLARIKMLRHFLATLAVALLLPIAPSTAGTNSAAPHWAYIKPVAPAVPRVKNSRWPQNPIDYFVAEKLEAQHLSPSPAADRATFLRRVSLDLIGLPPTPAEVDEFLHDSAPNAFEKVVDRLLASPHYGERWARPWLDLARYADTQGYEKDNRRTMWPYRDWVIDALNRNLPFDQFTIEQIAGDLLPNPTVAQRVATGFHRNTMTNTEGGTDDEEFRHEAIVDRVNTTFSVWMGTTFGCCQCHNHKYDPFSMKEYYQAYALLNNTVDSDKDDERPTLQLRTAVHDARAKELRDRVAALDRAYKIDSTDLAAAQARWEPSALETKPGAAKLPDRVEKILQKPANERTSAELGELANYFRTIAPEWKGPRDALAAARKAETDFEKSIPRTSIMEELAKPRETHLLIRGSFLTRGDSVNPGTPASLHAFPAGAPTNRLGFARWLVDTNNPLTARVAVNRAWESFFAVGLVETSQDFGTQGEPPSNQKLLDWLATEFMRTGWDTKALHRLIALSATYRQSARATPRMLERDPDNRLLARGPRARLEAEMLRDQALFVSGLLSPKLGGPSVMPPQPDGLWQVVYNGDKWETSAGADKYRRGLYTFWRRTMPHPAMTTFDAPSREFCVVRRTRSDTPLQALVLLNDPEYIEAARALAARVVREHPGEAARCADLAFRLCLARSPSAAEVQRLVSLYQAEREKISDGEAVKLSAAGETGRPDSKDLAAWTVVANVLLNLDEFVSKP